MRTISLLSVIAGVVLITLPSCKKSETEQAPLTQTINATVKVNETYSFILPVNETPDPYTVVQQSAHSSVSVIEKNSTGDLVYNYTPSSNYSGNDVVVISDENTVSAGCAHPGCNHQGCNHHPSSHQGNYQHSPSQRHIITINFTVLKNTATKRSAEVAVSE